MDYLFGLETNKFAFVFSACFNPCFDGLPFWTFSSTMYSSLQLSFNPCSDGLPFWTRTLLFHYFTFPCFNPCSDGLPFWTITAGIHIIAGGWVFQSLF